LPYGSDTATHIAVTLSTSATPDKCTTSFDHVIEVNNDDHTSIYDLETHSFEPFAKLRFANGAQDIVIAHGMVRSTRTSIKRAIIAARPGAARSSTEVRTTATYYDALNVTIAPAGATPVAGTNKETLDNCYDIDIT